MGVTFQSQLWYGFIFYESDDAEGAGSESEPYRGDFEERLLAATGLPKPDPFRDAADRAAYRAYQASRFGMHGSAQQRTPRIRELDEIFNAYNDRARVATKKLLVDVDCFGRGEYLDYYLFVKASQHEVDPHPPEQLGKALPPTEPHWDTALKNAAEILDLEFIEPQWHLSALTDY